MDYELAKELKDAGFPFKRNTHTHTLWWPTLEELIAQLAGNFYTLERISDTSFQAHSPVYNNYEIGSTASIALARLWLALNKKI